MAKLHHGLLPLLALAQCAGARNIVVTSDGIAVVTATDGGPSLVTYDASEREETTHDFSSSLPRIIQGFDDVAVDPDALAVGDRTFVFAIDAASGFVCSFELSADSQGVSLDFVDCTTRAVASDPFVGIAAMGGTLVVSGGTGGASVFTYDEGTGWLSQLPTIKNKQLGNDIGYPDVTLVTPQIAALSADVRGSRDGGFGVVVSSIDLDSRSLRRDGLFPVEDSVEFDYVIQPANFPLTSAVYAPFLSQRRYLYVANGGITVQDPERGGEPVVVTAAPNRFRALCVGVNTARDVAVFGGIIPRRNGRVRHAYVVLDISDPMDPVFESTNVVSREGGRITGIVSTGRDILYVKEGSSSIGHDRLRNFREDNGIKAAG